MIDTTFREKIEPTKTETKPVESTQQAKPVVSPSIEVPYTDYENKHNHPFIVDHFELGDLWNNDKTYTIEVQTIENFLKDKIKEKKISNSLHAVKGYLSELELTVGINSYEPTINKLGKVLSYIKTMQN